MAQSEDNNGNGPQQHNDAQNLDDLTSLQHASKSLDGDARDGGPAEHHGEGGGEDPSLVQSGQDDRSIRDNAVQGGGFSRNPEVKGDAPIPPSGIPASEHKSDQDRQGIPEPDSKSTPIEAPRGEDQRSQGQNEDQHQEPTPTPE